jgi:putative copper export protein
VLPITWTTVRLFLHVLAATVWVGGQLTLAGLVPGLRRVSPEAPRAVARRFNTIAWVAFAVLVATGIWNILAVRPNWSSAYGTTLIVKLVVVAGRGARSGAVRRFARRLRRALGSHRARRTLPRRPARWVTARTRFRLGTDVAGGAVAGRSE